MSEAEQAWQLWHLLQQCAEVLWDRYESAFLEFCAQGSCYCRDDTEDADNTKAELPF